MKYLMIGLGILIGGVFCKSDNKNIALVYKGPGACKGCPETVGWLLQGMGMNVKYLSPKKFTKSNFKSALLYVQPGGTGDNSIDTLNALDPNQIQILRDFISGGGRYLGICAGGYLAGQFFDDEHKIKAFGFLPMTVNSELTDTSPQFIS